MSSKVQNESRAERRRRRSAPDEARAPRTVPDIIDFIVASLLLVTAAFFARESLNPDGVGYLEIAEAITRGRWGEVLQGYWSPGFPALLAPLVFIAGDDRPFLLLLAHVLQAAIGVCALWLVRVVVKRRVPDALHRVAAWVGAWVILRFLSQVLITPDLALCAALLGLLALQGSESRAAQIGAGLCAGAAFLLKTSIWPWGLVAIALTAWPSIRIKRWNVLPWRVVAPAAVMIGGWLIALSVHTGRPTLGSVGPLNASWYLADASRRTPDTDLGPFPGRVEVPRTDGAKLAFADFHQSERTYLPWSDPEAWANLMVKRPAAPFSWQQAATSWTENALVVLRWVLPVVAGLLVVAWLAFGGQKRDGRAAWIGNHTLFFTGAVAVWVFQMVHLEIRLVAPAMFLLLFGALGSRTAVRESRALRSATWALLAGVFATLAVHLGPLPEEFSRNAESERSRNVYLDQQLVRNPNHGAIIVGPATPWMAVLWRHHMHVVVQFGAAGSAPLAKISDEQRVAWLRGNFQNAALGFGQARVTGLSGRSRTEWEFVAW